MTSVTEHVLTGCWSIVVADQCLAISRATTDALLCQMGLVMRALSHGTSDVAPSSALPRPEGVPEALVLVSSLQQPASATLAYGMLQFA